MASLPAYDRTVASEEDVQAVPAELLAELERLRATSAEEVARLHAALRESTARARDREREIERLTAEVATRTDGARVRRRRGLRGIAAPAPVPSAQGVALLAQLEHDRRVLEDRARALAETEARQRAAHAALAAERERLAELAQVEAEPPDAGMDEGVSATVAQREEELERRAAELALLRRQLAEVQRGVDERAWRIGALGGRSSPRGVVARAEATFTEGLQALARGGGAPPRERRAGSW